MMKDVEIKSVYEAYARLFSEQLDIFYPTVGSRGFDERNQVHLFLKALSKHNNSDIATWMEVPFNKTERGQERIDGLAFDKSNNTLYLVEAKRIKQGRGGSNAKAQLERIKLDVARMDDEGRIQYLMTGRNAENYRVVKVVLCDIWKNKDTEAVLAEFANRNSFWKNWEVFGCNKAVKYESYFLICAVKEGW